MTDSTHDPMAALDDPIPWTPAQRQLVDAQDAYERAQAALEQLVRDLVESEQITISDAARALAGTPDAPRPPRQRVQQILGRGTDGAAPRPRLTPTVYLRGAHCGPGIWERVEQAMWVRGWATTRDRTTAWHLARGGVPVVLLDFSAQTDAGWERPDYTVGLVRARYRDDEPCLEAVEGLAHHARPYRIDDDGSRLLDEGELARAVGVQLGRAVTAATPAS